MLTEREREWLNNRDNHAEHFCRWCDAWEDCQEELNALICPSWTQKVQLREAAEFEARVAATLANIYAELDFDYGCHDCPIWRPCSELGYENCKFMILKYARMQVEEEMDNEMDKRKA